MMWAPPSSLLFSFLLPYSSMVLLSLNKLPNYLTGQIASDEHVIFFPTLGNRINGTHWHLPVHGWIFEPELDSKKRKLAMGGLGKLFRVDDPDEKAMLRRRLMPFAADNQSMQYVNIRIGGDSDNGNGNGIIRRLPRSAKDGHFVGHLVMSDDELSSLSDDDADNDNTDGDGIVRYEAVVNAENNNDNGSVDGRRRFAGSVHLISPTGTSIISDIDDTVKITNYLDKREFYKNTFLREFREVPGMGELFRRMKSREEEEEEGTTAFHFVSASPYQLYEELRNFLEGTMGFPPATYHLKRIRIKDKTLLQLFADPMEYKLGQIEPLLKTFPRRKFVLIGDSGEKDPEVYAELYRRYPGRIEHIWIRNVNDADADVDAKTRMAGVDPGRWGYFDDGHDLADRIGW